MRVSSTLETRSPSEFKGEGGDEEARQGEHVPWRELPKIWPCISGLAQSGIPPTKLLLYRGIYVAMRQKGGSKYEGEITVLQVWSCDGYLNFDQVGYFALLNLMTIELSREVGGGGGSPFGDVLCEAHPLLI